MSNTKTGDFWGIIGKLVAVLTAIWIVIQMINHFSKTNDFEMEISGNHYPYYIAYKHKILINEYKEILALNKSYTDNIDKNGISIQKLKEFNESDEAAKSWRFKSDFDSYMSYEPIINLAKYNEIWSFNILNIGNKPIEDLLIEIPFKGYYKLITQKGESLKGEFENRIQVGNLAPGYSLSVITWVENIHSSMPDYIEEKTRITHKYGWEKIDYPVKANGLVAWNMRNHDTPLFIAIVIIIIIIFISFVIGVDYGPKFQKKEKERKLKELKELEKLKEEGEFDTPVVDKDKDSDIEDEK